MTKAEIDRKFIQIMIKTSTHDWYEIYSWRDYAKELGVRL